MSNLNNAIDSQAITLGKVTIQRLSDSGEEFFLPGDPDNPSDRFTCDSKTSCCA